MVFTILLLLKILLFMNITLVQYNKAFVFFTSALFIILIFTTIYSSNKEKKKKRIGLIVYTVLSLILFIDVLHYTYFNALPSVKMLSQVNQVAAVGESVKSIFTLKNILMILDLPLLLIGVIVVNRKENYSQIGFIESYGLGKSKRSKWLPSLILIVAIVGNLIFLNLTDRYISVANQEPFLFHEKDIREWALDTDSNLGDSLAESQITIDDLRERAKLKEGKHTGIGKGKNLIVLQVESLQDFVINEKYEGQEITPNLNKLIKDKGSLYFDNYYQNIGRGNTSDAEFVTNNSLYPSMEEPSYTKYQDNSFYGLPIVLKENGYTPWAFHGYKKEFWNREKAYVNQGYERFIGEEDFDLKRENIIGFGISDEEFYKQSIDYIKELDKKDKNPFYAFVVSLTSHNPFTMPEHERVIKIKEEHEGTLLGNYINSVHYADREIGNFIEMLKEEGLYDDTVIAIYGDHFAISSTDEKNKAVMSDYLGREYRLEEMMKIPLIINVPGENIRETISKAGSQMDFYPTIMNIMGVDNDKGIVFGRDLVNYQGENLVAPQAYALKGSFINDHMVFNMSKDGVFENSEAYEIKTGKKLDVAEYKEDYRKVISEINLGDYIMKEDLMGDILEGRSNLLEAKVSAKNLKLPKEIKNTDSSLEDIEKAIKDGYKGVRLNLDYRNNQVVVGKNTPIRKLEQLLKENEDVYVVTTVEDRRNLLNIYTDLGERYKDEKFGYMKDRIYPEVVRLDAYPPVRSRGFNVILNISEFEYKDSEALDYIERYDIALVAMTEERNKTGIGKRLKKDDVLTYIYNVDSSKHKFKIRKNNYGVFVD